VRNVSLFRARRAIVERSGHEGQPARVVVHVTGEVDVATSALLAATLARAMETESAVRADLVVDLAKVRFIDASGINVLLNASRQASAAGGSLVLRSPSRPVCRLLAVLRLSDVLTTE
jgi:anti-sigma B factor antagonist